MTDKYKYTMHQVEGHSLHKGLHDGICVMFDLLPTSSIVPPFSDTQAKGSVRTRGAQVPEGGGQPLPLPDPSA